MSASRAIRGIIFDMGDVLYDASIWRRAMAARLGELGVKIDFPGFVARWEAKLVDVYKGRRAYWDALVELLADFQLDAAAADAMLTFARDKAREVEHRAPMDGVPETLAQLRQRGVRLAVLSDTEAGEARVRAILASLGIEQHFDAVVTSRDIGHVKPEPQAFQAAVAALGVPMDACAFVGHDEDEMAGAQAVGLYTIAYNHAPTVSANAAMVHFSDLLALIATTR